MLRIVEGVPGSGKTYYAVKYLLDNFVKYDDFFDEYIVRDDVLVISNIENLKIKHLNLDTLVQRFSLEKFFTVENIEKVQKQYRVKNIVFLIDEAQRYFHRRFFHKDVFYFFQYHRHLGCDIFLITQSYQTLSREIVVLAEYIVRAVPRSRQPFSFLYHYIDTQTKDKLFSKSLRKSQSVFRAYTSMKVDEIQKPQSVFSRYVAIAVFLFVLSISSFFFVLHHFFSPPRTSQSHISQSYTSSSSHISQSHQSHTLQSPISSVSELERYIDSSREISRPGYTLEQVSFSEYRSAQNQNKFCVYDGDNPPRCFLLYEK